mgnify:CR=1 FL=1
MQKSFSQSLFDEAESQKIRDLVMKTLFIRGMTSGLLNADDYGAYMVQDIAYLANGAKAYQTAAKRTEPVLFAQFYRKMAREWECDYLRPMQKAWHLGITGYTAIVPGFAANVYMDFLTTVSEKNPKYLAIAMLPCTMLWRWMADQLVSSVSVYSAYYSWFQENKSDRPGSQSKLEQFVDRNFDLEAEFETAKRYFCTAMVHECNFFRESGNQEPCKIPPTCQGSSTSSSD